MRRRTTSRVHRVLSRSAAALLAAASLATVAPGAVGVAGSEPSRRDAAIARAQQHLRSHGREVRAGAADGFVARDVVLDADGADHVRFDRTFKGLAVVGGDVVVHESGQGGFRGASLTLASPIDVDTTPTVDEASAVAVARGRFAGAAASAEAQRLVVWARSESPVLAREVLVTGTAPDGGPSELHVFVDAKTGAVVDAWDGIEHAKPGSGAGPAVDTNGSCAARPVADDLGLYNKGVCVGTVYSSSAKAFSLIDPDRFNQTTYDYRNTTSALYNLTDADNVWGNGATSDRNSAAVDAHYGAAATWDYYRSAHGRLGINGNAKPAQSRVHYGRGYNNAFWSDSCFCMVYGDGDGSIFNPLVSLDVAGHEMTHGVTSRTANLTYSGESGGLNESTSDVFGAMVEFSKGPGDWTIGEDVVGPNFGSTALRFMKRPSLDGTSPDCYRADIGTLDVHYSSGVGNRAFAFLADGSAGETNTCGAAGVTGIGRDAAAKVWYRALTTYWTSSTNYAGARAGTLSAATDVGVDPAAVAAAWSAVGVN